MSEECNSSTGFVIQRHTIDNRVNNFYSRKEVNSCYVMIIVYAVVDQNLFGWDNVTCHSHKLPLNMILYVLMKKSVHNIKQHNNLVNELQNHLNNTAGTLMII